MREAFAKWWRLDDGDAEAVGEKAHAPVTAAERRETVPLLMLAFGWGFLITGLIVGGALGQGLAFGDLIEVTAIGNVLNFVFGALVAYIGYKTGANTGMLFRYAYGESGAKAPALLNALLTICWQGIIVGAFGFAWTQSFDSGAFYAVAIFGGLLFTATTYFGMKGLERVAIPATIVLVVVGLYAGWLNVTTAGGWDAFIALSSDTAARQPLPKIDAINLVVGSWIVDAIVMSEYTRFAKKAWVALAIPFIVMIVAQWFLQIIGAMGGVVSGTYDFTTYMLAQGAVIGAIGVVTMSFALWTTGDANLYLPAVQTANVFSLPQRVTTVICGVISTLIGLGIYQRFLVWIDTLASIAPPLIGPLLVEYYLFRRPVLDPATARPGWNWPAFVAYVSGAAATFYAPDWVVKALLGLGVSIAVYAVLALVTGRSRFSVGEQRV